MISPDFVSKWKVLFSFAIFLTRNWFLSRKQSDQIGRFITLWATFQRSWQQLFYPKCQHILGNFCKFVKICLFTNKILLGNFYWSHCWVPMMKQNNLIGYCKSCCKAVVVAQLVVRLLPSSEDRGSNIVIRKF